MLTLRKMPPEDQGSKRPLLKEKEDKTSDNVSVSFLKFSFSEKATKICAIFLMVLVFTKVNLHETDLLF